MRSGWPVGRRETPLARRRLLGLILRELCGASGLGVHTIAKQIEHDPTWVAKVMRGDLSPHPNEVRVLLPVVGLDPDSPAARAVLALARSAYGRGRWWRRYADVVPDWFTRYLGLESEVTRLHVFDSQAVPDLLQTRPYAEALLAGAEDVDRRVGLRLARQEALALPHPPLLDVILDEAVLRRAVGAAGVLRDQLGHLLTTAERPNVRIRVLPFSAGAQPRRAAFTLLDFPRPPAPLPHVVDPGLGYVELLASAVYLDQAAQLAAYRATWTTLAQQALDPPRTRELIDRTRAEATEHHPR